MTRRLQSAAHVLAVVAIALAATRVASLPVASQAVSISSGVTAALLANALLPCPCHRRGVGR